MHILAKMIEAVAVFGANCVSICLSYQPELPEELK